MKHGCSPFYGEKADSGAADAPSIPRPACGGWRQPSEGRTQTRIVPYSYPDGGLAQTSVPVTETVTNAGRPYVITTIITDLSVVPAGNPDEGAPTVKRIQVNVTPMGAATAFETVTITTQRSTQVTGIY